VLAVRSHVVETESRLRADQPRNGNGGFYRLRRRFTTGDVTPHSLRHTALSGMIARGFDDYTVSSISGHSSIRMLARYTHPAEARKADALTLPILSTKRAHDADGDLKVAAEISELLEKGGGRQEARTPDLRVANAALSQLS